MPKLIPNAKALILDTAKSQLLSVGYEKFTIRDIAKQCSIGVGTIYNYFSDKQMLIASIMAQDWFLILSDMKKGCDTAHDVISGIQAIYDGITAFSAVYEPVWKEYSFAGGISYGFGERHVMLRAQLADMIEPLLLRFGIKEDRPLILLYSETVLTCAMQKDIEFETLRKMTAMLFI